MDLPLLWIDGAFHGADAPAFAATDRGATLGDAVFDTVLCLGGKAVERTAHIARLTASITFFKYRISPELLMAAYDIAALTDQPAVLRVAISRGAGARGFDLEQPHPSQITASLTQLPAGLQWVPQRFDIADSRRNDLSPLSRHKVASYLDTILALNLARSRGCTDTFFLNTKGDVACSATGNVFAIFGNRLITPPLRDGALPGITRALLLHLAPPLQLIPEETPLSPDMLRHADEIFVCNSLRLMVPATNFGGPSFQARGKLAHALFAHIAETNGVKPVLPNWAVNAA